MNEPSEHAGNLLALTKTASNALSDVLNKLENIDLSLSDLKVVRADTANIIMDIYGLIDRIVYERFPELTPEDLVTRR